MQSCAKEEEHEPDGRRWAPPQQSTCTCTHCQGGGARAGWAQAGSTWLLPPAVVGAAGGGGQAAPNGAGAWPSAQLSNSRACMRQHLLGDLAKRACATQQGSAGLRSRAACRIRPGSALARSRSWLPSPPARRPQAALPAGDRRAHPAALPGPSQGESAGASQGGHPRICAPPPCCAREIQGGHWGGGEGGALAIMLQWTACCAACPLPACLPAEERLLIPGLAWRTIGGAALGQHNTWGTSCP